MEQFFTRNKANEGIKVYLQLPTGEVTEEWIHIRGAYSDAFRKAERESLRRMAELQPLVEKEPELAEREFEKEKVWLVSQLVTGWSFHLECNEENVIKFFVNAPQVLDHVNTIAGDTRRFFSNGSAPSSPTQNGSSNSKKSRKGRNKR